MIVFEGCLALVIFPASQAPHKWSFLNLTPSMPMICFFFMGVCKFLMPACPSLRCQSQHSEAFARRHTASCGPAEKSTMYRSSFQYPSKTRDLSDSISTRQRYFPNITIMFKSQSIETDIKLKPRDSTSITLSMCWSFEIATLPRPNTLLLLVSANVMWLLSDGRKVESMRRLRSPVIWLVHPLSIIHSEAFGVIPYSAVRGIGFTKSIVKQKHLTNQWVMKA